MIYFILIFGAILMIVIPTRHESDGNYRIEDYKERRYSRCESLKNGVKFISNPVPLFERKIKKAS